MRLGRRYFAPEEGGEGAGGGGAADLGGAAASLPAGSEGAAAEPKTDMLAAIDAGLGYKKGEDAATGGEGAAGAAAQSPEEKAAAETKAAEEKAIKDRDAKAAAGDPVAIKAKTDAEAAAKLEAAKPKDLKALELTEADKRVMKGKTAERYNEVLGIAKTERAAREQAETKATALAQSRDAILDVLKETNTSDQDLAMLLEFNRLQKSPDAASLEQALGVINGMRLRIMKTLGKEGDGHDPLAEFPDLQAEVADMKISKERALEIVATRKRESLAAAERQKGERMQGAEQAVQRAREQGITSIDTWSAETAKKDIDFKAKEAILLEQIEGIVRNYPPNLWLPTIKTVYAAIVVQKAPAALPGGGDKTPLRSSGAKPGGPAPTSMQEAIDQGLGYAKT